MGTIGFSWGEGAPVLHVRFEGNVDDERFEAYLADLPAAYAAHPRLGVVIDATHAAIISGHQQRRQAEWMREHDALIRARVAGYAFVITNPVIRLVLTGILWISPLPVPHLVCKSAAEAEAWVRDRLAER